MPSLRCLLATVLPPLALAVAAAAQGALPSQTQITLPLHGTIGGYGIPIEVRPAASVKPPLQPPTGTVTLFDGANAVGPAVTLADNSGIIKTPFAQVFGTPDPTIATAGTNAVWADFNGDGLPDLLVYGSTTGSNGQQGLVVQDFLGKASSNVSTSVLVFPSFTPLPVQQLALPLLTQYGQAVAVLDVDGDGHLDLLAGNTVAYGNGDGTFGRVGVLAALASGFNQTYAVDMDGDGRTDIVAVDTPPSVNTPGTVQYAFTVFHNNGSGSFTAMGPYPLAPSFTAGSSVLYNIFGLSFADVNGDGRVDVLSQSNAVPSGNAAGPVLLNVMVNLGTGFSGPQAIDTSTLPALNTVSTAFADLNGDGKLDLVLSYRANTGNNGVAALLGNDDGSFAVPVNLVLGTNLTAGTPLLPLVTEDINGDGKPDVVLGSGVVALGNGDGTLTLGAPLFTSSFAAGNPPPAYAVLAAPPTATISGGETSPLFALVFINLQSGANAIFLPQIGSGATVTAMLAAGQHLLSAQYSGDANYAASLSNTLHLEIGSFTPKVMLTSSANPIYASQPVTFTATLDDPTITGSVTFVDTSKNDDNPLDPMAGTTETTLGMGTIADGVATLTTKLLVGGTHTILAVYGPDINAPIAQAQLTETVNLPFAVNVGGTGVSLTASSGQTATATLPIQALGGFTGPVTFACQGQPTCNFSPATVTLSGTGTVNVTLTVTAVAVTAANTTDTVLRSMALACGLPLFALLGFAGPGRRRILLLVFGVALCVIPFTGCGGGGSSSSASSNGLKAGAYPFYITATSGQNVQVLQGTLTVQ